MEIKDSKVLVTGAGRGIGRGIALSFAAEGADVAVSDLNIDNARAVTGEIEALGQSSIAIKADVSNSADVGAMVAQVISEFGSLDILVNNAGVISVVPVIELEEAEWDRVMNVNSKGVFLCSKAAAPHMIERKKGSIINVASVAGKMGSATMSVYAASKFSVIGFTQALSKELAPYNINVNAICPGIVDTYMTRHIADTWDREYDEIITSLIPQNRGQTVEDMGRLAIFFATMDNMTGQSVNLDGGLVMH